MKLSTLLFTLSVSSAALLSSHTVNANEQLAASICDYVGADDKSRIRKKLKESRVKLRNIYAGISCGGNNLIRHAIMHNFTNWEDMFIDMGIDIAIGLLFLPIVRFLTDKCL